MMGTAEGRPHKGRHLFTFPCVFPCLEPMLVVIVGISVNSLSQGYTQEGMLTYSIKNVEIPMAS